MTIIIIISKAVEVIAIDSAHTGVGLLATIA